MSLTGTTRLHWPDCICVACEDARRGKQSHNTPEPPPKPSAGEPVWELVIADMRERDAGGTAKYGQPLTTGDGRKSLVDAYQEGLDFVAYLKKELLECPIREAAIRREAYEECARIAEVEAGRNSYHQRGTEETIWTAAAAKVSRMIREAMEKL